ncbi:hypothetical protein VTH82DRAFT_5742 [Thermothelomyces myriococcoides]
MAREREYHSCPKTRDSKNALAVSFPVGGFLSWEHAEGQCAPGDHACQERFYWFEKSGFSVRAQDRVSVGCEACDYSRDGTLRARKVKVDMATCAARTEGRFIGPAAASRTGT